jgi:hypothetical protein
MEVRRPCGVVNAGRRPRRKTKRQITRQSLSFLAYLIQASCGPLLAGLWVVQLIGLWEVHIGPKLKYYKVKKIRVVHLHP